MHETEVNLGLVGFSPHKLCYRLQQWDKELSNYQKKSTFTNLNAISKCLPGVMCDTWLDKKELKQYVCWQASILGKIIVQFETTNSILLTEFDY